MAYPEHKTNPSKWYFLLFVFIGLLLMAASGLITYYLFCTPNIVINPSDGTRIFHGKKLEARNCPPSLPALNCPPRPTNLPFCNSPPPCPAVVASPCTANPAQNCRPCIPVHPPCMASNCQPALPCATLLPVPVPNEIRRLTETEMAMNTAFNLITRHQINSYERLQVAIQVMNIASSGGSTLSHSGTAGMIIKGSARCIVENDIHSNKEIHKETRFDHKNQQYVEEPSNNGNRMYAFMDRLDRDNSRQWFPEDVRRRALHSAKEEQFNKYTESDVEKWKWGLRHEEYVPFQINQRALSFWIDKPGTPNRRSCTPCDGTSPLVHMNCTSYPHHLYVGGGGRPPRTTE
uniref:Uncharacterized protein n=1 Tax=Daphnia galeata TaxID=27404 RepID=A0A8J2RWQ5_9CRUS|nr:unnamed protein product [Daphnia galeata]